jgi:GH15 family glucan-1,4-alpha-glucosidase
VLQGRFEEARKLFERLLTLRNDVGLLTEEYDPTTTGEFPASLLAPGADKYSSQPDEF